MRFRGPLAALLTLVLLLIPSGAQAFSTRIHIMIASQVREALVAANDGSIPLRLGDHAVILPQEDFEAIRD